MPPPLPPAFYYAETSEQSTYTETPTSDFDLDLMLANEPCWITTNTTNKVKPKHLIICDWTAPFWSTTKQIAVMQKFTELLQEGFTISIWQAPSLQTLTISNLSNLKQFCQQITIDDEDTIHIAARANGISRNQLFLIDDYWLNALLSGQYNAPRRLNFDEFMQAQAQGKILKALTQAQPALQEIILNEFPVNEEKLSRCHSHFPDANLITQYKTIYLDQQSLIQLMNEGRITAQGFVFERTQLQNITNVHFSDINFTDLTLLKILTDIGPLLSAIKTLGLYSCEIGSPQFVIFNLLSLKEFNFYSSTLDTSIFTTIKFKRAASGIKKIHLPGCTNIANFSFDKLNFKELEEIDLSTTDIDIESLLSLWRVAPNLKKMVLSRCTNLINIQPGSIPPNVLEEIDLSETNINAESLFAICQACPNLKKLNLSGCQQLIPLRFGTLKLNELEELDLSNTNIDDETLRAILQACPNLKKINLANCKQLSECPFFEPMASLEEINLSETYINETGILNLCRSFPNLKKINLANCTKINAFPNTFFTLRSLEYLDVSNNNFNTSNLLMACHVFTKLKKINLYGCPRIAPIPLTKFAQTGLSYNSLEIIKLPHFFSDSLLILLQIFPHLKEIDLGNCKNLAGIQLPPASLNSLEKIYFHNSDIDATGLKSWLAAAPNLSVVGLSGTSLIYDQELIALLKNIITVIVTDNSVFSAENSTPPSMFEKMKNFKPTTPDFKFRFTGRHTTKNQAMIVEKLSQYLVLTNQHLQSISRMQDGICNALSHYFADTTVADFDTFVHHLQQWNGAVETLTPLLSAQLDRLYQYVEHYQFSQAVSQPLQLINRQDVRTILSNFTSTHNVVCFRNPWHAITVRHENESWIIYDPIDPNGPQKYSTLDAADQKMQQALGNIIAVETSTMMLGNPAIANLDAFIAEGGLLAICQVNNVEWLLDRLQQNDYSPQSLEGLLIRTISGTPAWIIGMKHSNPNIKQLTQKLLQQFITQYPRQAMQLLQQSMTDMPTPLQQQALAEEIIQIMPAAQTENTQLRDALLRLTHIKTYETKLKTWEKKPVADSILHYCQLLMNAYDVAGNPLKSRLIALESAQALDVLSHALHNYGTTTNRAVFYIDKPEQLRCAAPYVFRHKDNHGELRQGPGGPLYDFLATHDAPILIINYGAFSAEEIVRFNSLLDKTPQVDGIPLPEHTLVLGLIDSSNPDGYQGADFYSRFDCIEHYPFTSPAVLPEITVTPVETQVYCINLYYANDWKNRLLGRWVMKGQALQFEEGELIQAIHAGLPIEIQNGLWENAQFVRFWQLLRSSGIWHAGRLMQLNPATIISHRDGYDWQELTAAFNLQGTCMSTMDPVLNAGNLSKFFRTYACANQQLTPLPGLIAQAAQLQQPLAVRLTSALTKHAWAMLLAECRKHNVTLQVACAPGVELPEELRAPPLPLPAHTAWDKTLTATVQVIVSSEPDTTVVQLTQTGAFIVIDVSECRACDLITRLANHFNAETLQFTFDQQHQLLINPTQDIILTGEFSAELRDALTAYLLEHAQQTTRLVLVTTTPMPALPTVFHQVTAQEKRDCLGTMATQVEAFIDEPLSKLQARLAFLAVHPEQDSTQAWQGIYTLPPHYTTAKPIDFTTSAADTQRFTKARLTDVRNALQHSPYALLTGLTGVGKTTFVLETLTAEGYTVHCGTENIAAWANDTNTPSILFLDEANLGQYQWSEFEGLFHNPPTILIKGKPHTLTTEHKVVFAANPLSYGGGRHLPSLFARHGSAICFAPLPAAVIYEQALKPLLPPQSALQETICQPILAMYTWLQEAAPNEILVTPRELEMMVLLALHSTAEPRQIYYNLIKAFVPTARQFEFDQQFKPTTSYPVRQFAQFIVTKPQQAVVQHLESCLQLRQWRRTSSALNDKQKYGGLGGVILEGEPGIGKSELVTALLVANGYHEERDFKNPTQHDNIFYRLPVSMDYTEKTALLLKAFNEGAVVIIDEINSSPMMEQLLNALLMGRDLAGNRPQKPGFMIIGTQNPITLAGRRPTSHALQHRLTSFTLPSYSTQEMQLILQQRGVPRAEAELMVQAYEKNCAYAQQHHCTPAPCFRDLLKLAPQQAIVAQPQLSSMSGGFFHQKTAPNAPKDLPDADLKPC